MSFNAIRENKILAKISEFTVDTLNICMKEFVSKFMVHRALSGKTY